MKKGIIVLFVIIIYYIILFIPFIFASVFINEVELNPSGTDSGNEWVEVFTDGSQDLTGWYITDKDDNKIFFPSIVIDNIYVLDNLTGLVNTDENVSLFDSTDNLINSTGFISDSSDNDKTWQKIPDGNGILNFSMETKGFDNDGVLNVPADYSTIQEAISASRDGDIINVSSGTYSEPITSCDGDMAMFCINKSLIIRGDVGDANPGPGINKPIIDGNGADASAFVFKRSASVSNSVIEGFEITDFANPSCCTGGIGSGILAWDANTSKIIINDNYLNNLGWNGILVGSDDGSIQNNWTIKYNIIENSDYAGIELTNVKNSFVGYNEIKVGSGIVWDPGDSGVGIEIAVRDHGTGVMIEKNTVSSNNISFDVNTGTIAERAGINILSRAYTSASDAELNKLKIIKNNVSGITKGIYVTSESRNDGNAEINELLIEENILYKNGDGINIQDLISSGSGTASHSKINIFGNLITKSTGPGSGIHINPGTSASNILINFNSIIDNNLFGVNNEGNGDLNATYNYWGSCDGPSPTGSGDLVSTNVIFKPWLGICIEDKTETQCAIENKNLSLMANVSGIGLEDVWFSYTINGTNLNKTGLKVIGTNNNYSYTIDLSELIGGETLLWNVYANDSFGNLFNNSWRQVYIRNMTSLLVNPLNPNGASGWYVTEPLFTLLSDVIDFLNSYYRWDSSGNILYSGSFGLENIPNAPPVNSSGILELNWFSEFSCGNESEKRQVFYVDLTDPVIKNLKPLNNSIVHSNNVLTEAYLDEIYQSNSGINKSSVIMKVDNNIVPASVVNGNNNLDAIVNFSANLSDGMHNATVYAEDNAGRISMLEWSFKVNTSEIDIEMFINSPNQSLQSLFNERRIPINLSLNEIVDKITYIDYSDSKPKERILCRNCDNYGKNKKRFKSFKDGFHNVTFRAIKNNIVVDEENVQFTIDSKKPKIMKTEPRKGFSSGTFNVEFMEENPTKLILFYGNGIKNASIDINNCVFEKNRYFCSINVNLSEFEGLEIGYWFELMDIVGNTEISKVKKINVDTINPLINSFNLSVTGKRVLFLFNITEENFDEITYIDHNNIERERNLCSRLKEGKCEKSKNFNEGLHNLTFYVKDQAGNNVSSNTQFEIL